MPPFEYRPYSNPYVASMSRLLLAPGEIEAQRAATVANAQARAAELSGQAIGGAIQGATQGVTGAISQAMDPKRQFELLQLQHAKDIARGGAVIDRAMQSTQPNGPQPEGAAPAAAQHPYLDDEGLADPKKISDLLAANGLGHLAPELLQGVDAQNKALLDYKQHREDEGKKQAILVGTVANTTMKLMDTGMSFQDAAGHAASSLIATRAIDPQTLQTQIAQLAQLPPDQQMAALKQLKATASQLGGIKDVGKDNIGIDIFGEKVVSNIVPEKPKDLQKDEFGLRQPDGKIQNVEGFFDPDPNSPTSGHRFIIGPDGKRQDVSDRAVTKESPPPVDTNTDYRVKDSALGLPGGGTHDMPLEVDRGRAAGEATHYYVRMPDGSRKEVFAPKDFVKIPTASQEPKPPVDVRPEIQTSVIGGLKYVDASRYAKDELGRARTAAEQLGVPIVSKEVAEGVAAADRAAINLDTMWGQLNAYLPKDAAGRVISGPANTLDKLFQTNPVLGSFGTWRIAAIQAIQALAEKGMGLRLNQVEIQQMIDGLPKATDDAPTAANKMRIIGTQLQNKVKVALTNDRSSLAVPGGIIAPSATPPPNTSDWHITNRGGR